MLELYIIGMIGFAVAGVLICQDKDGILVGEFAGIILAALVWPISVPVMALVIALCYLSDKKFWSKKIF
jgi:hypothetical protein